jgi:predicted nucleic acid-binding protein
MNGVVVSDASPLHYLILIDVVELLPRSFSEVFVPPAVIEELSVAETPAKVRQWIAQPPVWLKIVAPQQAPNDLGLDLGETQAIWLGEECGIRSILIDERKGTRVAQERGFLVAGTLAIIERFAGRDWIEFEDAIARLRATTFRFNERLIVEARERLKAKRP